MATIKMGIGDVVLRNYLPYAKMTIQERAIPDGRDGLKPVQRKVLYSSWELAESKGGRNVSFKCARIVGDTMGKYHPHGDSSIYGALVMMTDDYNALNTPYITGEGTFGRVWSEELTAAAMRYTEAHLAPITDEMFEGIKDNTIEFIPNFDESEKEPMLLPVKFPAILVNSTDGLAVGLNTCIPSYNLKSVCDATVAMATGKATKPEDLVDILGLPDFTTGGYVHGNKDTILKLIKTGRGTLTLSGSVRLYKDAILVDEVPYNTTLDRIIRELKQAIADEKIKDIKDIIDSTGMDKKVQAAKPEIKIELKAGADVRKVLAKINRYTSLRNKISYNTKVLMAEGNEPGAPKELGIFELLERWLSWRSFIIQRSYKFKADKEADKAHKLEAWEFIKDDVANIVNHISKLTKDKAMSWLMEHYGMDEIQAEYLMDKKLYQITTDQLKKALKDLDDTRQKYREDMVFVENEKARMSLIVQQVSDIGVKYGKDRVSKIADEICEETEAEKLVDVIPDVPVTILMTQKGLLKRVTNALDTFKVKELADTEDPVKFQVNCSNKDLLLVFTYSGACYKVPVCNIDSSTRTSFKDYIWKMIAPKDDSDILYACAANNYTGGFNVIYNNGKGIRVPLKLVNGKRNVYVSLFEPGDNNTMAVTNHMQFFIITKNNAAAYADLTASTLFDRKAKFKIARLTNGDRVIGIQPWERVPNKEFIDLEKYSKGYTVKIREDVLW